MSSSMDDPTQDLTPAPPRAVEAKLAVAASLAGLLYALGEFVRENTGVLDPLPAWARGLVLALLPAALAFLAGYRVPSNRV